MIFTIEPMINAGKRHLKILNDGWTVVTKDRSLSAQWEHTLLVTETGCEVLTLSEGTPARPGANKRCAQTPLACCDTRTVFCPACKALPDRPVEKNASLLPGWRPKLTLPSRVEDAESGIPFLWQAPCQYQAGAPWLIPSPVPSSSDASCQPSASRLLPRPDGGLPCRRRAARASASAASLAARATLAAALAVLAGGGFGRLCASSSARLTHGPVFSNRAMLSRGRCGNILMMPAARRV